MKDIHIVLFIFYFLRLFNVFFVAELRQESVATTVCLYKRKTLMYKTKNKNKKKEEWFCITYSMYLLQM